VATGNDLENIKKRIDELDKKIDTVSFLVFSYIQSILSLLQEKEFTNPEELKEHLERSRNELLNMGQNAQFQQMMNDLFPDAPKPDDKS